VSVTAFTYQGAWPNLVYDWFLRASYSHPNITVVPFCDAYREKLGGIGVTPDSIRRIPWGVSAEGSGGAGREPGLRPLVLWAGYICPIGRRDFLFAYDTARKALEDGLKAEFVFAFKPECHEARFARLDRPDEGITVTSTSEAQFAALKSRADVFYSPVITRDVIVGPPLTWIEMLACGVPIVTTDVEGVSEAVTDGVTGYVAAGEDDVVDRLKDAVRTYGSMKDRCAARVRERYDIAVSAGRYMALWRDLAGQAAHAETRTGLKGATAGAEACALKVKGP
jgi:glycosyltransferase involved in cell wall biosynthesis